MQIAPLSTRSSTAGDAAVDEPRSSARTARANTLRTSQATQAYALKGKGVRAWDPEINQQVSSAQQALGFLDKMGAMLESLKNDIGSKLAVRQSGDARLDDKLRQFNALWQERQQVAGGSLDGRLDYSPAAPARQRFAVRGIDLRAMQSGPREKLEFSVGAPGQGAMSVDIEPGMTPDAIVRRFNQALAAADIRVEADAGGQLMFSVPESTWAHVRDTLAVKGGGARLPAGKMHRARIDAVPDVIRPDTWETGDVTALRRTLQSVIDALDRIRQVKESVQRALAQVRSRAIDAAADQREWAASFAEHFEAMAQRPDYQVFFAIAPALTSISRTRVLSLLALP